MTGGLPVASVAPVKPDLQGLKLKPNLQDLFKLHLHIQSGNIQTYPLGQSSYFISQLLLKSCQKWLLLDPTIPKETPTTHQHHQLPVNAQHLKKTPLPLNNNPCQQLRETLAVQKAHRAIA